MKKKPDDLSNVRIKIWPLNSVKKCDFMKRDSYDKRTNTKRKSYGEPYICSDYTSDEDF